MEAEAHQLPSSIPESHVLIIMTGGTICMQRSPSGFVPARGFQENCLARLPTFNDGSRPLPLEVVVNEAGERRKYPSLRTPPSAYDRQVRYTVFEFEELLDSSSIDAKGWAEIARTIAFNYTLFDAFVVLHGTDSLAYTCSALSFMLQNLGKPVILTGSQAPMLELQNDAADNLLGSLVVAGHFMIPEVCLYFNYKLFRGNRATKIAASDFAAFDSPNCPPLAVTTSMRTQVAWDLVRRPTKLEHFSIQTNLDTNHVACLRIFPGIKPEMVDAVLKLDGLRGLVLETFGAGNAPGGQDNAMTKVLANSIQRGIVIVNVTQCECRYPSISVDTHWVVMWLTLCRSFRKRQSRLRPRDDPFPRGRCRRSGHDDRSGPDEAFLPACSPRRNTGIGGPRHVGVPAGRADAAFAARVPPPGGSAAGASQDPHRAGLCHCSGRSGEGEGYHEGRE